MAFIESQTAFSRDPWQSSNGYDPRVTSVQIGRRGSAFHRVSGARDRCNLLNMGWARLGACCFVAVLAGCSGGRMQSAPPQSDAGGGGGGSCSAGAGGSPIATTLAHYGVEPNGMSVAQGQVYWATVNWGSDAGPSGTGTLQRVSTGGGAVTVLGTAYLPYAVAANGSSVYWTTAAPSPEAGVPGGQLLVTPVAGGATKVLAEGFSGSTIALSPSGVYALQEATSDTIVLVPFDGGPVASVVASSPGQTIQCFAIDATNLYWVAGVNGDATLMKMPLAGGASTALAKTKECGAIAVGSSTVVWGDSVEERVLAVPLGGGAATTLYVSDTIVGPVAVDCDSVYFATGTAVLKEPLAGGAPTTLASLVRGWGTATALAFDDTSVYFVTQDPPGDAAAGCAGTLGCSSVQRVTPK
jgi:hypothetical protein